MPPPHAGEIEGAPPHPDGGVALVDGEAYAGLRPDQPALVQAFDADGHVVYTRWLNVAAANAVRDGARLPTEPTVPPLPPSPLRRGEILRLAASSVLMVASGTLFVVAAEARTDWYALDPSPVTTLEALERLRVRTNLAQGAGLACGGVGLAGLLSVAVRVPF